jgi:hypothetical protein
MYKIMKEFGIPEKIINLVKMTLEGRWLKFKLVVNYLTVMKHVASDKGWTFYLVV